MKKTIIQVLGFLISTAGWFIVCCTLAMNYWRSTYIGGQGGSWVIKAAWYWSTLWRNCYTDTTAVDNCREYNVIWAITPTSTVERGYIQAVRVLLMFGMTLGFFAAIFCFFGMECTYLGGKERTNDRILLTGAVFHFFGGVADAAGYCLFTNRLGRATFARTVGRGVLRYEIGPPVYLGLVGSVCIILGSILYAVTVYRVIVPKREADSILSRKKMTTKTYVSLTKNRTIYSAASNQSSISVQSNSHVSRISQISEMSDRDAFV